MNNYFETPALSRLITTLRDTFPSDIKFGTYNRRYIAGYNLTWSQHSWPNAADIYFTKEYGDTSAAHQARLDKVADYLRWQYPHRDEINHLLWRRTNHYDHIHVDMFPRGYGTPSIVRGGASNRYQTKSGTIITQAQLIGQEGEDALAILTDAEQVELQKFLQNIRDTGSNVDYVKYAIQNVRDHRAGGPLAPTQPVDLDDYEIIIQRKEV